MKPVYQTILKPPLGNCLQACIASVLELPLEGVPNFMEADGSKWWDEYTDWMVMNWNLQPLTIKIENGNWKPRGWHFIQGKSPRGDYDHLVVGYQGEVVHDPYPDGEGLAELKWYELLVSILESYVP